MAPTYDSIMEISDERNDWCFFARVLRVWTVPLSMEMAVMDRHGATIYCTIEEELIPLFKNIKENCVYVMHNFRVTHNDAKIRTSCHNFKLEFLYGTKIRPVDGAIVPVDAYVFDHPTEFLSLCHQSEFMIGVIGMLETIEPEKDVAVEGKAVRTVALDLDHDGTKFKCFLYGRYVDQLNHFVSAGRSDNCCVTIMFAKVQIWKCMPTVHTTDYVTKMEFNPDINALTYHSPKK